MITIQHFDDSLRQIATWEPHVHALVGWGGDPIDAGLGAIAGPLAGWTVGVKDIIAVAGSPTGLGAPFLSPKAASRDAAVVRALRHLGARVVAKTVTTTFAFYDPGPTRNPWNLAHTPGGSSSGSAAAVACGMVRLALGTQTIGSINRPAAYCGVVGFKPSYGSLPASGVFPLASDVDTVGTFTTSARDAATAFSALTGTPVTLDERRLRVGLLEDLLCPPPDSDMRDAVRAAARRLERAGHSVRAIALPKTFAASYEHHRRLVAVAALDAHRTLVARHAATYPPKMLELLEHGRAQSNGQVDEARNHRNEARVVWSSVRDDLDVLLCPAAPDPAPPGIEATGDPRMNLLGSYLGIPALTLPAGLAPNGLPLGVQLLGGAGGDADVLRSAVVIERALEFVGGPPAPA